MTRRGLIGALLGAATMDPERLLWVPGAKVISIPKPVVEKEFELEYLRDLMRPHPGIDDYLRERYLKPAANMIAQEIDSHAARYWKATHMRFLT